MPTLRAIVCLVLILLLTLILLPFQIVFYAFGMSAARKLPGFYHQWILNIIGLRVHTHGTFDEAHPSFIVANHISWLDIPVISSLAPLSFVAKSEIASWPVIGYFAKLQNCIFVQRERRTTVAATSDEILDHLKASHHIVLFPEGTSGDGNRVLPFKTSLFSAVKPGRRNQLADAVDTVDLPVVVQTCTLAYTHVHGIPIGRVLRPIIAWYGDMEMAGHAWTILKSGPIDVHVSIGAPKNLVEYEDRKHVARETYAEITTNYHQLGRSAGMIGTV